MSRTRAGGSRARGTAAVPPPTRTSTIVAVALAAAIVLAGPPAIAAVLSIVLPEAEAGDRPCRVWIRGQQMNIIRDSDGNPRSNPDGTLYPGDAFYYAFYYGFSGCVGSYVAQPVTSYRDIQAQPSGHSSGIGYVSTGATASCFGSRGGVDEIGAFGRTGTCGGISKTVYGYELHCSGSGKKRKCTIFVRSATDMVVPRIKAPVVEVDMREHSMTDTYGYPATNKDMTNYVWDPIAVEHVAAFTHLDEREGTITFEYDRSFGPLQELGGFERDTRGTGRLVHDPPHPATESIEFQPYSKHVRNGGGMYAYAAQDDSAIGRHDISYTVRVLNEGREINSHRNSTEQLVVSYEPMYDHHPYPVLADIRQYAYDDRHGIAMRYHGSYGGGSGDEPVIHPERRSFIHGFNQTTTVGSSAIGVGERILDPALMEWESTDHIDGTDHTPYMSRGEHAMFVEDGYGVVRLAQEASGAVIDDPSHNRWADLAWVENAMQSGKFAGRMNGTNFNYTYVYPPAPMAGMHRMTAYDRDGGRDWDAGMSITSTPLVSFGGMPPWNSTVPGDHGDAELYDRVTVWLDQYMRAKTMRETGDERFVDAVLADTHGRHAAAAATFGGVLEAWFPKTALEYRPGSLADTIGGTMSVAAGGAGGRGGEEGYLAQAPGGGGVVGGGIAFTEFGGATVEEIVLPDDDTDYEHPFLVLPRHLALSTVPYTELYMTAASWDGTTAVNRNRTVSAYPDYLAEYSELVNIEDGNQLDTRRFETGRGGGTSPTIFVTVDKDTFGDIAGVVVDGLRGSPIAGGCKTTCTLSYRGAGNITAYNVWGGSASGWVNASDTEWYQDPTEGMENASDVLLLTAAIAIASYVIYRAVRAVARARDDPAE